MIVVQVKMRSLPERRAETLAAVQRMQESTRRVDAGCIEYSFAVDVEDDCVLWCIEQWADRAALRSHLNAEHMREPDAVLADTLVAPAVITVFDAEQVADWRSWLDAS